MSHNYLELSPDLPRGGITIQCDRETAHTIAERLRDTSPKSVKSKWYWDCAFNISSALLRFNLTKSLRPKSHIDI